MYWMTYLHYHVGVCGFNGLPEELRGSFALACLRMNLGQIENVEFFFDDGEAL